jgi:hypothetical protein
MADYIPRINKGIIEERQGQLDLLFEFANADLEQSTSAHPDGRILDLLDSAMVPAPGGHTVLDPRGYTALLPELQKHLRRRLNAIIRKTTFLNEMRLWKISGSVEFTVEGKTNRFRQRIQLRRVREGGELKVLKMAVDLVLMLIIQDLSVQPDRFRRCPRCKVYFYQPTGRKKEYCSPRCNDAARVERFTKRKKIGSKPGRGW